MNRQDPVGQMAADNRSVQLNVPVPSQAPVAQKTKALPAESTDSKT